MKRASLSLNDMLTMFSKMFGVNIASNIPASVVEYNRNRIRITHIASDFYPSQRTVSYEAILEVPECGDYDPEPPGRCDKEILYYERYPVIASFRYLQTRTGRRSKLYQFQPKGDLVMLNGERFLSFNCGFPPLCKSIDAFFEVVPVLSQLNVFEDLALEIVGNLEETILFSSVYVDGPVFIPRVIPLDECDLCVNKPSEIVPHAIGCPDCAPFALSPHPIAKIIERMPCPPAFELIDCECKLKTCPEGKYLNFMGECVDIGDEIYMEERWTFWADCAKSRTIATDVSISTCMKETPSIQLSTFSLAQSPGGTTWIENIEVEQVPHTFECCPVQNLNESETCSEYTSYDTIEYKFYIRRTFSSGSSQRRLVGSIFSDVTYQSYPQWFVPSECDDPVALPQFEVSKNPPSIDCGPDFASWYRSLFPLLIQLPLPLPPPPPGC